VNKVYSKDRHISWVSWERIRDAEPAGVKVEKEEKAARFGSRHFAGTKLKATC
jgi:hypothetical protein